MKTPNYLLTPVILASLIACGKSVSTPAPATTTTESVESRSRHLLDQLEQVPAEHVPAFLAGHNLEMRIVDSEAAPPAIRQELRNFLAQHHVDIVGNPVQ